MQRTHLLECASNKITNHSAKKWGPPQRNFSNVADRWSQILGVQIDTWQVGLMLVDLQIARMASTGQPDNEGFIDICCYAALAGEVVDG